jgi:hypothetical protein
VTAVDATTPSESANASSDDVTYATFTPTSEAVLIVLSGTYADDQTTAGSVSGSNPTLTNRVDVETNAGTDGSIFVYEGADFGKTATGSRTHATTSTNNAVNNGIVLGLTHEAPIAVVRGGPPTRSLLGVGLCCCCCSGHSGSLSSRRSRRRTRT